MLNVIWLILILAAVILGGIDGRLPEVTQASFDACKTAVVTIALPLAGIMALWLGIMRLAEKSGLISVLARALRPVMRRLFPDVPPDHPAMGSMLMNMAANMLGLGNAATPLGLRAMQDLEKLNTRPGVATNAMCTFLAINTSSIQLLPVTVIAILSAAGSLQPTAIVGTSLAATTVSTVLAIIAVKILEKLPMFALPPATEAVASPPADVEKDDPLAAQPITPLAPGKLLVLIALTGFFIWLTWQAMAQSERGGILALIEAISALAIPFLLTFFPLYAFLRGVKVYEEFVEGAKEGVQVAIRIIPFLVAILVAVGMLRASGGIQRISDFLAPVLLALHFPPDLLSLVLIRPLSGSGATGVFTELVQTHGPDSLIARMGATFMGSSETTFYVIAVYFGSIAVTRTRHAVAAGLIADIGAVIAAIAICNALFR